MHVLTVHHHFRSNHYLFYIVNSVYYLNLDHLQTEYQQPIVIPSDQIMWLKTNGKILRLINMQTVIEIVFKYSNNFSDNFKIECMIYYYILMIYLVALSVVLMMVQRSLLEQPLSSDVLSVSSRSNR